MNAALGSLLIQVGFCAFGLALSLWIEPGSPPGGPASLSRAAQARYPPRAAPPDRLQHRAELRDVLRLGLAARREVPRHRPDPRCLPPPARHHLRLRRLRLLLGTSCDASLQMALPARPPIPPRGLRAGTHRVHLRPSARDPGRRPRRGPRGRPGPGDLRRDLARGRCGSVWQCASCTSCRSTPACPGSSGRTSRSSAAPASCAAPRQSQVATMPPPSPCGTGSFAREILHRRRRSRRGCVDPAARARRSAGRTMSVFLAAGSLSRGGSTMNVTIRSFASNSCR